MLFVTTWCERCGDAWNDRVQKKTKKTKKKSHWAKKNDQKKDKKENAKKEQKDKEFVEFNLGPKGRERIRDGQKTKRSLVTKHVHGACWRWLWLLISSLGLPATASAATAAPVFDSSDSSLSVVSVLSHGPRPQVAGWPLVVVPSCGADAMGDLNSDWLTLASVATEVMACRAGSLAGEWIDTISVGAEILQLQAAAMEASLLSDLRELADVSGAVMTSRSVLRVVDAFPFGCNLVWPRWWWLRCGSRGLVWLGVI